MVTNPAQMAIFVAAVVAVWAIFLVFVGPRLTPYSRKQWALIMGTLMVLQTPITWYLIFVVGTTKHIDPRHVARIGALSLLVGVPLFIVIGQRILKTK